MDDTSASMPGDALPLTAPLAFAIEREAGRDAQGAWLMDPPAVRESSELLGRLQWCRLGALAAFGGLMVTGMFASMEAWLGLGVLALVLALPPYAGLTGRQRLARTRLPRARFLSWPAIEAVRQARARALASDREASNRALGVAAALALWALGAGMGSPFLSGAGAIAALLMGVYAHAAVRASDAALAELRARLTGLPAADP